MAYEFYCAVCGDRVYSPKLIVCEKCRPEYEGCKDDPLYKAMIALEQDNRNQQRKHFKHLQDTDPTDINPDDVLTAETAGDTLESEFFRDAANMALSVLVDQSGLTHSEQIALHIRVTAAKNDIEFSSRFGAKAMSEILGKEVTEATYRKHLSNAQKKISQRFTEAVPEDQYLMFSSRVFALMRLKTSQNESE